MPFQVETFLPSFLPSFLSFIFLCFTFFFFFFFFFLSYYLIQSKSKFALYFYYHQKFGWVQASKNKLMSFTYIFVIISNPLYNSYPFAKSFKLIIKVEYWFCQDKFWFCYGNYSWYGNKNLYYELICFGSIKKYIFVLA